jgi:hypothetical protein
VVALQERLAEESGLVAAVLDAVAVALVPHRLIAGVCGGERASSKASNRQLSSARISLVSEANTAI